MNARSLMLVVAVLLFTACGVTPRPPEASTAGRVLAQVPATPAAGERYVIYLHAMGLDGEGDEAMRARFRQVVEALARTGSTVIAEIRGPGTIRKSPEDLDQYARKVASQVQQLLDAGVPARRIHVVGYSRGGVIALMTSGYVSRPNVRFGVLAGCVSAQGAVKQFVPVLMRYAEKLKGDFLSVVEDSDADFGSCMPYFAKASGQVAAREATLRTGKGHLLFSLADESWLAPLAEWLKQG